MAGCGRGDVCGATAGPEPVGIAAYRSMIITERQFQVQVRELVALLGWDCYCWWSSMHSPRGFPDLVLVNADKSRIIFAELKSEKGKVSAEQRYCLDSLARCHHEVYLWRPADIEEIARVLRLDYPACSNTRWQTIQQRG